MFEYRWLKEEDYMTLYKWWKDNRFTPPTPFMLPENGTGGFMIFKDGVEICAGFLYQTNSQMAWIEYIVANFEVKDKELRKEALTFLIERLNVYAKSCGFKIVFTSLKHPHLKKRYLDTGFLVGTENTTELIKLL